MLTQLETAAAESLLQKLIASHNGEDCRNFASAYCNLNSVAWERSCRSGQCGTAAVDAASTPQGAAPLTTEPAAAETPTTRTRKPKAGAAAETPAAPAVDLGIGGAAETPAAEPPAAAATPPAAGKSYPEKQAELKAAYINKLRILTESNAAEGDSFKNKVAAEMARIGAKKLSEPGEENIDAFYSFIVNVIPDKGEAKPLIEI